MWTIGYKDGESQMEMQVDVDECSPKDHYLFLYNEVKVEVDEKDETDEVVEIADDVRAHVRGYFSPPAWLYALHEDVTIVNRSAAVRQPETE